MANEEGAKEGKREEDSRGRVKRGVERDSQWKIKNINKSGLTLLNELGLGGNAPWGRTRSRRGRGKKTRARQEASPVQRTLFVRSHFTSVWIYTPRNEISFDFWSRPLD